MSEAEIFLQGGRVTAGVVRVGDTVRRPIAGDRTLSQALLRHLEAFGFAGAPRFLGLDLQGREILSFLPGEVPADMGYYDDHTLVAAAALLRRFHDATVSFPPVMAAGAEVMCHNDWGPHNAVFVSDLPTGLIDFDTVKPGLRLWDLGYSAFSWLNFGNDAYTGDEQIRRLRIFASGYGEPHVSVETLAAFVVARQAALAAAGRAQGKRELADWAEECARWTVTNVTEPLLPTGMIPV